MKNQNMICHIDDGSMGGGGPIPHDSETTEDEFLGTGINDPDSIVGKYFTKDRYQIFHYCCFGHVDDGNNNGWTHHNAYYFWISDANNDEPSYEIDQAQSFMHELGHNLDLYDLPHTYPEGTVTQDDATAMRYGDHGDIDYHWIEWKNLDLVVSLN